MTTQSILRLKLIRDSHMPTATGGEITGSGLRVRTLESVWDDNRSYISCIPLGTYRVMRMGDDADNDLWTVIGIPDRTLVTFFIGGGEGPPRGNIVLADHCCISGPDGETSHMVRTNHQFNRLTEGLRSFTLDIHQKLPYTEYIEKHGLAQPPTEEIQDEKA